MDHKYALISEEKEGAIEHSYKGTILTIPKSGETPMYHALDEAHPMAPELRSTAEGLMKKLNLKKLIIQCEGK